jgi:hypothetical protein
MRRGLERLSFPLLMDSICLVRRMQVKKMMLSIMLYLVSTYMLEKTPTLPTGTRAATPSYQWLIVVVILPFGLLSFLRVMF